MLAPGSTLLACPRCSTTDAVRAAVFAAGFWAELAVLLLPLAIIAIFGCFLHGMRTRIEEESS
jgi:hypothetical protein